MIRIFCIALVSSFLAGSMGSCKAKRAARQKKADAAVADRAAKDSVALALMNDPALLTNMQKPDTNYRLVVSFISTGQGTDRQATGSFKQFLAPYDSSGQVIVDKVAWGREGEIDYCIRTMKMNGEEEKEFVTRARAVLAASTLVHVDENAPCRRKR